MHSIGKNFIYNVLYQILLIILPLITAPYISRVLGAGGVGVYSYTYSVAYNFLLLGMLGMTNLGNRTIASVRDDLVKRSKAFFSLYTLQFIAFTLSTCAYLVYLAFFLHDNSQIAVIQTVYVISGFFDISWFFFGLEKFKLTVSRNTIIKLITAALIFIFVKQSTDLWKYTTIIVYGTLLSQVYLWLHLRKYVCRVHISIADIKQYIKPLFVLFIPVVAYIIYKVMDKIMLGLMSTYEQVGYYDSAMKIVNIPLGVIAALGTVMLPHMTALISKGETDTTERYICISIKFVTLLASAICFGLIAISPNLAPTYFGKEYVSCALLISLLSVTCFFIAWANVARMQYLIPRKMDLIYITSTVFGGLINLIVNLIMIPRFQSTGAAIGTIAAEFSVMAIQMFALRKYIKIYKYIISSLGYIIIGFIIMIVVRVITIQLGNGWMPLIIEISTYALIYIVFILVYMLTVKDELFAVAKRTIIHNHKKEVW